MLATHTILYPTDLCESSPRVFELACALARDHDARLIVLHVELPPVGTAEVIERRDSAGYYAGVWQELRQLRAPTANIQVEHHLVVGHVASEILRVAGETQTGLIVMGTHGRSGLGRLLMGSVAEGVVRQASCPVLTVKFPDAPVQVKPAESAPDGRRAGMLSVHTILHPTDFSSHAKGAFARACALARDYGARLVVVHVKPIPPILGSEFGPVFPPEPTDVYEDLRKHLSCVRPADAAIPVEHHLREGDAATQILSLAGECKCDLIVMGTHGRTGLGRVLLGSVAEAVVRQASCPVLTIKTPVAEGAARSAPCPPEVARA
jgi:nucleotide-binding universal stress UspA family protein